MKQQLLTKMLLVAVLLCVGGSNAWADDVNIFTSNAKADLSVAASTTDQELTSTNATIKGGKMFVTNGQESAKNLIATANEKVFFVMTNGNTSFKVTSNHTLKAGDKIKIDVYLNSGSGGDLGLWFTTASSRPGAAPTASKVESFEGGQQKTLTYTVAESDGICGQSTFYIYRANGTTTYFNNVIITRDYTTLYSNDYENASKISDIRSGDYKDCQIEVSTNHYLKIRENGRNGGSGTMTFPSYSTDDYQEYVISFKMGFNTSNNKSSSFQIKAGGTTLATFGWGKWDDAGATVSYTIGSTAQAETLTAVIQNSATRASDTNNTITKWYTFTINGSEESGKVTLTVNDGSSDVISNSEISNSYVAVTGFYFTLGNAHAEIGFDDMSLRAYSEAEIVPNPTAAITGVNGTNRTVTLTLGTGSVDGTTMAYSTNSDMSESTAYTDPFTVSSTSTIYFQSTSPTSAKSEIQSINVTCEAVKLNAPTISRSGNSVTITSDQSDVLANPSATIYYTYGSGDPVAYSSAITVAADATITAYASAAGYTNSDNATRAVAIFPSDVVKIINGPESKTYTTSALSGVDVVGTNATFQALMLDGAQWGGENVYVPTSNFNWRKDGSWYIGNTSNVWLLVKNLKAGDIIVANTSYQASGLTNATYTEKYSEGNNRVYTVTADGDVEIAFKKPNSSTMHYFYGLYVWSSRFVSKTITAAGWATYFSDKALDFSSSITNLTKAYIITGHSGATLTLSPIITTIPANTGILLEGEGEVLIPVTGSSSTDVSANILKGVTSATVETAGSIYVLMNETAGVGFYKNNNDFTVGANTAYIDATDLAGARSFYLFEDDATAIEAVKAQNVENGQFFNLAGQRVAQPTKGLYIVNGKKVIIK